MVDDLSIGQYRIVDNSFHQYPSITVFEVKGFNDKQVVIKKVVYVCRQDPYNGVSDFDEYIADRNFAIISNSRPLDEANRIKVIQLLFGRLWNYYG